MPNLDKTGPAGAGAKTGGQIGKCSGAKPQAKPFDGRGKGMSKGGRGGRGAGQGPRGRFNRGRSDA